MQKRYTADFETTTNPNDCRVWAWSICNIDNYSEIYYGNTISSFFTKIQELSNCDLYFHNLRFDSQFIIWYLLQMGYTYYEGKDTKELGFTTLINGENQIYKMDIIFRCYTSNTKQGFKKSYRKVSIYDSLKKLPFTVKKIAKDFDLPIQKLELDYNAYRNKNHILTSEEKAYLTNDVEIMARALHAQFEQGLTRMTIGSDALFNYKNLIGEKQFKRLFPVLSIEVDDALRKAYHGGWTYVNPKFQGIDIGKGKVYDVNSLYPWAMRNNSYPVGEPYYSQGKYEFDALRPLYIQRFMCEFKLKEGKLPCVQIKKSMLYSSTEYLTESVEPTVLCMCNIDLKLFFDQYDVYNVTYIDYWCFFSADNLFTDYIDGWYKIKENSTGAVRALAKLMLNNLYGKFATSPKIIEKMPILEDNRVKYVVAKSYMKEAVYIPVGIFCTAYAREKTIRTAQKIYDRFIYADTDSLHIVGEEEPEELHGLVDDKKLGLWKNESNFVRARFLKAKSYIEEEEIDESHMKDSPLYYERDGKFYYLNVKCAGMNDAIKEKVTYDNFKEGFSSYGKLLPKNVKGGVVLEDTEFTIKPVKISKKQI